jgi:hypothetical protein
LLPFDKTKGSRAAGAKALHLARRRRVALVQSALRQFLAKLGFNLQAKLERHAGAFQKQSFRTASPRELLLSCQK